MSGIEIKNFGDSIIKIFEYVAKNPFVKLLDIIVKLALLIAVAVSIINFKGIIEWGYNIINDIEDTEHIELINYRLSIEDEIDVLLTDLCTEVGGDAAFIFEFHNGSNNLTGMPFFYMDMTYEHINADDKPLYGLSAWKNVPVTGYSFINKHYKNGFFIGDVEKIAEEDKAFSYKLLSQGTNKIAVLKMYGKKHPIGLIGVATGDIFERCDVDVEHILFKYAQQVAIKLDADGLK